MEVDRLLSWFVGLQCLFNNNVTWSRMHISVYPPVETVPGFQSSIVHRLRRKRAPWPTIGTLSPPPPSAPVVVQPQSIQGSLGLSKHLF